MSRLMPAVVVAFALASPLSGQPAPGGVEITVFGGASVRPLTRPSLALRAPWPAFYELRSHLDRAGLVGLRIGRYFGARTALELDLSLAPSQRAEYRAQVACRPGGPCPRDPGGAPDYFVEAELRSWQYALALTYDLREGGARPYLGLAAGGATDTGFEERATDARLGLAAGVKLGRGRLRGRLELADFVTPTHFLTGRTEHDLQVRAGLSLGLR